MTIINWYQLLKEQSIGRRFAFYILVFSSIVTLASTILQLSIEYQKEITDIDARLHQIHDGYSKSLAGSLWVTSTVDLELQMDGIIKLPDMQYIEIRSDKNEVLGFRGVQKTEHIMSQSYPLKYVYREKELTLGSLHIVATLNGVYKRLGNKVLVILLTQGVKTFMVSLFILFLFQLLVGRHLTTIAQFLSVSEDNQLSEKLKLEREKSKFTKNDELDLMINTINKMRENLKSSFEELKKSEENLYITLHSIGDAVIATNHEGVITQMNPTAERLTAWSLNEAGGKPLNEVFKIISTETGLPCANPAEWVMQKGEMVDTSKHRTLLARDNNEYKIAMSAAPIRNTDDTLIGVVLVFSDVTQQYVTQAQISRLTQVVNQNPFSTIITDCDSVIQDVNTQCIQMTGYRKDELLGKKMNIFCSGMHSKSFFTELWDTISIKKQMWRGVIINKMKDGRKLDCNSTIFPLYNSNNEIINYVSIQEDVTEQNIKNKLFMMQTRQAQMGEMLSMIAHQWRQPLSIISALMSKQRVEIELENYTLEGLNKRVKDVDQQVQYLSHTMTDFKDFFKPDKEKTDTRNSILFNKALGLIGHTLKENKINILQTHQHDEPYQTYEHELVQVILNILKNAQDAFIEKAILDPQITIISDQIDNMSVITVEDNAQGIDSSVLDTLFLPYISTKSKKNGTGLGLYMSNTIVQEHCGGALIAENTNNGAKFTIRLPLS